MAISSGDRNYLRGVVSDFYTSNLPDKAKRLTSEKSDQIIDYFQGDETAMVTGLYEKEIPKEQLQPAQTVEQFGVPQQPVADPFKAPAPADPTGLLP